MTTNEKPFCLENWIAGDWHCEEGTIPVTQVRKAIAKLLDEYKDDIEWLPLKVRLIKHFGKKLVEE